MGEGLTQQGGVVERAQDVGKGGGEERHAKRDVNRVPERHQAAGVGKRGGFHHGGQAGVFQAVCGARDAGVDVTPDEAAEHDHARQQQGDARQPLNFQEECRNTMNGPTMPVKMWNCSQSAMRPQRAERERLRRL